MTADSPDPARFRSEFPVLERVAYLKRALGHLHQAQAALEKVAAKKLLSPEALTSTRAELFAVREEVLRLMNEFRRQS